MGQISAAKKSPKGFFRGGFGGPRELSTRDSK